MDRPACGATPKGRWCQVSNSSKFDLSELPVFRALWTLEVRQRAGLKSFDHAGDGWLLLRAFGFGCSNRHRNFAMNRHGLGAFSPRQADHLAKSGLGLLQRPDVDML